MGLPVKELYPEDPQLQEARAALKQALDNFINNLKKLHLQPDLMNNSSFLSEFQTSILSLNLSSKQAKEVLGA